MSSPTHGVVSLAALDLRRRPDHRSELRSQLLMGEVVRIVGGRPGAEWRRIENESDGYRGWARSWGFVPVSAARAGRWRRAASAHVSRSFAEAREAPGRGAMLSPLFWGARVIPGRHSGRHRAIELPDGRRGWVESAALAVGGRGPLSLTKRIRELLGVPYLWGGRTPVGLDCSAFTQLVLAEQGLALPRDAAEQERSARQLREGNEPREGDLVFFGHKGRPAGHAGLVLGGGYFAHARGQVRINSLDPTNPLYDNALARQFRGFRRPIQRT